MMSSLVIKDGTYAVPDPKGFYRQILTKMQAKFVQNEAKKLMSETFRVCFLASA